MSVCEIFFSYIAKAIHISEVEVSLFCTREHIRAFCSGKEFAFFVKKFEGIPVLRIMRGGENKASVCVRENDAHFGSRGRSKSGLDHINSASHKRTADNVFHHLS